MDWSGNLMRPFVPRPDNSFNFAYNYNYDQFSGIEMKHAMQTASDATIRTVDKNNYGLQEKKKRLTNDQLESLENSFQEEIKLDPDRKMKLAKDLGLQPRQIAVWFQNRRARWKAKQLERLYDALKQEFDVVSREKQKLQEEVLALRSILKEHGATATKQVSAGGYKEISGEETVESTSIPSSNWGCQGKSSTSQIECDYPYNVDEYNAVMQPFWGGLPSYP